MIKARIPAAMDDVSVFDRFLGLAKKELQANDVRLLEHGESVPDASNTVTARLQDGRHVVASFEAPPKDADALARRLTILADTFAEALANPPSERNRARQPVGSSLHEELRALSVRSGARDAVVIDIDTPVIWGSATVSQRPRLGADALLRDVSEDQGVKSSPLPEESGPLQDFIAPAESSPLPSDESTPELEPDVTRQAISQVRCLPGVDTLHKGRHLRHAQREAPAYLAMSFSGIYILILVFEGEFDELRAERAAHESLSRIERLVEALPPLDPTPAPMGGVIALRRPRRR
jgi:hypothetical protein